MLTRFLLRCEQAVLRSDLGFRATAYLVFAVSVAQVIYGEPIHHDIASHFDLIGRWLGGERFYVDFVEINPPLIFYIYTPVALAALVTGLPEELMARPYAAVLLAIALALTARVMARAEVPRDLSARRALVLVVVVLMVSVPGYDFGQRENLALAFVLPYVLGSVGVAEGRRLGTRLGIVVGILGGLGMAVKPFLATIWMLVEGYVYVAGKQRQAWRRPEAVTSAVVVAVYGLWTALGTNYLDSARIVSQVYGAYEGDFGEVFGGSNPGLWLSGVAALALTRSSDSNRHLRAMVFLLQCLFTYWALHQAKGWSYHWLPTKTLGWLTFAIIVCDLRESPQSVRTLFRPPPEVMPLLAAAGAVLLVAIAAWSGSARERYGSFANLPVAIGSVVKDNAPGRRVLWLSTSCYPAFPSLTYAGARNVASLGTFAIPSFYLDAEKERVPFPYHRPEERPPLERQVLAAMGADLDVKRPDLVVFDRSRIRQAFGHTTFDFYEYFMLDPRFAKAMKNYRRLRDLGPMRLFKRRDLDPPSSLTGDEPALRGRPRPNVVGDGAPAR